LGRVEIVTLSVGVRAKKGEGEGKGRAFSLLSLRPLPPPLDSPHFLLSSGVLTWRFRD